MKVIILLSLLLIETLAFGQKGIKPNLIFIGELIDYTVLKDASISTSALSSSSNCEDSIAILNIEKNIFRVRYKIKNVFRGKFKLDTIQFLLASEYRTPAVFNYDYACFIISKNKSNELINTGERHFEVYETSNNDWACIFSKFNFLSKYYSNKSLIPHKIDFKKTVSVKSDKIVSNNISSFFPNQYFNIVGNTAITSYGNFVQEVIALIDKE